MSETTKKASYEFIRLVKVKVENSHYNAYQMERAVIVGNKVVERSLIGQPDELIMVLAKAEECLNPESVVNQVPEQVAS